MFEIPTSQDPLEEFFNDDKFWLHQKYLNIFPRNVPFCGTWKIWGSLPQNFTSQTLQNLMFHDLR